MCEINFELIDKIRELKKKYGEKELLYYIFSEFNLSDWHIYLMRLLNYWERQGREGRFLMQLWELKVYLDVLWERYKPEEIRKAITIDYIAHITGLGARA